MLELELNYNANCYSVIIEETTVFILEKFT